MRSRLLRSSLLAVAVAVLLVGVPVVGLVGVLEAGRVGADLQQRADLAVQVVAATRADRPLASLTGQLGDVVGVGRVASVRRTGEQVVVGSAEPGRTLSRTASAGPVSAVVSVPRALVQRDVLTLVAWVVVLSLLAFVVSGVIAVVQARRLSRPLADLAADADRIGRGEARLSGVASGVAEVDQVAAALVRSSQAVRAVLAAEREFAVDASHQLRTPLTALSMRLEEITALDDPDQMREEAGVALTQVERLTDVVDSLLARTRNSHRSSWQSVQLGSLLDQQLQEWAPSFRAQRRHLVLEPVEPVRVRATPTALSQVLATLIENSLRHGEGTATVTARRAGGSVVVEVTDEGPGIPGHLGSRVFERAVSNSGSTGLGLALARDLAEADGGRLELVRARPPVFAVFLSVAA